MRNVINVCIIVVSIVFSCNISWGSNYPLEIIQPQEGLDTKNRFYKAYPGLEYNVRVAVIGGDYPFTYELVSAPSGMTINANTGVISWPNFASGTYSASVKVTDSENASDQHTWSITVTTNGFKFLDAVNGKTVAEGGIGTIGNPWKTIKDMYEGDDYASKTKSSYAYNFLYFKSGRYYMDGYIEDGSRLPLTDYKKPLVWLAYPGESPVLDMTAGYIAVYSGGVNVYVEGLEILDIENSNRKGWQIDSSANNVTFRKNDFHGMTDLNRTNMACVFIARAGAGQRWSFSENSFHDNVSGMGIEAYKAEKVLVEDNSFYNFSQGLSTPHALAPKMSYRYWFIRHNTFYNNDGWNIWADGYTDFGATEHIEISYNLVRDDGLYAIQVNYDDGNIGQIYVYRNTFIGPVDVRFAATGRGPFNFYNNVIINSSSGITCSRCSDPSIIIDSVNLKGTDNDNIVDSNGNLTSEYSDYLGTHGYQISETEPMIPGIPPDFKTE